MKARRGISILLTCALLAVRVAAQGPDTGQNAENLPPGLNAEAALLARLSGLFVAEDPTSVYQMSVYDESVEFLLDGSWTAGFEGTLDFTAADGVTSLSVTPPIFTQAVNLSAWIFIAGHWYFQADFAEEFTKNTIAFGYVGGENDAVKHVRIGNSGILFPDVYPFIALGGADRQARSPVIAPGAMGSFGGKAWRADAMVRYDVAAARELLLSGMNEANDTTVSVAQPVGKTWFTLPSAPVTGSVAVWVEDPAGTVAEAGSARKWRRLKDAEYQVDGLSGTLTLAQPARGAMAVSYSGADGSVSPFVAAVRAWFADRFTEKGLSVTDSLFTDIFMTDADVLSGTYANSFLVTINGTQALLLSEPGRFSPFENLSLYDMGGDEVQLVHRESGTPVTGYETAGFGEDHTELGNPALATAGGPRDPAGRYPLADRFLSVYLPPFTLGTNETDIVLRSRAYVPVSEISLGDKAIPGTIVMTRNGVTDTAFSFDPDSGILTPDRPPALTDSIRITWLDQDPSARNAAFTAALGGALYPVPGLSLKAGSAVRWNLSNSGYTDSSEGSPGSWIASAGAEWTKGELKAATAAAFTLTVNDTTGLYRVEGMNQGSVTFNPAKEWYRTAPEYGDTSISTLTVEGISGSVLRVQGTFTADDNAVAADILVGEYGSADLRNAATITVTVRNAGNNAAFELFLQGGAPDTGYTLSGQTLAEWQLVTPAPGAPWQKQTVALTEADRLLLGGWQNLRLIARPLLPASYPIGVAFESGPITVADGGYALVAEPPEGRFSAVPVSSGSLAQGLEAHSPDLINRLNPGGGNTLLAITIEPASPNPTSEDQNVSVSRFLATVPLKSYKTLSFELNPGLLPTVTGARLTLSLLSPASSGTEDTAWELSIPAAALASGAWTTVTVDLASGAVTADGASLPGATLTRNPLAPAPTKVRFAATIPAPATVPPLGWTCGLDEIRLSDTEAVRSLANETAVSWSRTGPIAEAGGVILLANPDFSVTSRAANNLENGKTALSGTAEAGLTFTGIRGDVSVAVSSEADGILENAAHRVAVPLGPINVTESMAADFSGNALTRAESIGLSGIFPVAAKSALSLGNATLTRDHTLDITPTLPLGKAGAVTLTLNGKASQSGASPWNRLTDREWSEVWADSLALMASPGESDAKKRTVAAGTRSSWKPERGWILGASAGLTLDETYSTGATGAARRVSGAGFDLSLPVSLFGTALTPSWKRSAFRRRETPAGGSWLADARSLGDSAGRLSWLWTAPPVADLILQAPDGTADAESAFTHKTAYSVDWDRPAVGLLSDLWVPVSAGASLARESSVETLAASYSDKRMASARLSFSALNLFGAYGIKGAFKWYEQDEFSQSYVWTSEWGSGYYLWTFDAWDGISLYWGSAGTFSIDNGISYTSAKIDGSGESLGGTVRSVLGREAKRSPIEPLIRKWTGRAVESRREDSLSWNWHALNAPAQNAEYDHRLITKVGANGEIKLSGGLTYRAEPNGTTVVSIRLSAGGTLRY